MSYHQWTATDIEDMTELQLNAMIEKIVRDDPHLQTSIGGGGKRAEKIKFLKQRLKVSGGVSTSKEKQKGQQS